MSLATFKKKSINKYSSATKRSGKPPGGYWLPQGPFGNDTLKNVMLSEGIKNFGPVGFSINGSHRSISVGKDMKMSQQGTRFRGQHPYGCGGNQGRYFQAIPVLNAGKGIISVKGNQWEYVKPSTVSNATMIHQKYKGIFTGKYPNTWVQPLYTGNQTDTASQGLYIQNKSAANYCWYDVNNPEIYTNYYKCECAHGIIKNPRGYKMVIQQSIAPYTKTLHQTKPSSDHTLKIQQQCLNPKGWQKPFPYAVTTGTGQSAAGTSITSFANSCNTSNPVYLEPPEWYTKDQNPPKVQTYDKKNNAEVYVDLVLNGTTGN
jgi:hypothetical protein